MAINRAILMSGSEFVEAELHTHEICGMAFDYGRIQASADAWERLVKFAAGDGHGAGKFRTWSTDGHRLIPGETRSVGEP